MPATALIRLGPFLLCAAGRVRSRDKTANSTVTTVPGATGSGTDSSAACTPIPPRTRCASSHGSASRSATGNGQTSGRGWLTRDILGDETYMQSGRMAAPLAMMVIASTFRCAPSKAGVPSIFSTSRRARYLCRMTKKLSDKSPSKPFCEKPSDQAGNAGAEQVRLACRTCR